MGSLAAGYSPVCNRLGSLNFKIGREAVIIGVTSYRILPSLHPFGASNIRISIEVATGYRILPSLQPFGVTKFRICVEAQQSLATQNEG